MVKQYHVVMNDLGEELKFSHHSFNYFSFIRACSSIFPNSIFLESVLSPRGGVLVGIVLSSLVVRFSLSKTTVQSLLYVVMVYTGCSRFSYKWLLTYKSFVSVRVVLS